jgi:hypothetical protein
MKAIVIILGLLLANRCLAQLEVKVLKSAYTDDASVYEVSITNKTDSIACILHSIFLDLTSKRLMGLPLDEYQRVDTSDLFSLEFTYRDTLNTFESTVYRGECILPYQTLNFKVMVTDPPKGRVQKFSFEYFYTSDLCYRQFMQEMKMVGFWYRKYQRLRSATPLPM